MPLLTKSEILFLPAYFFPSAKHISACVFFFSPVCNFSPRQPPKGPPAAWSTAQCTRNLIPRARSMFSSETAYDSKSTQSAIKAVHTKDHELLVKSLSSGGDPNATFTCLRVRRAGCERWP